MKPAALSATSGLYPVCWIDKNDGSHRRGMLIQEPNVRRFGIAHDLERGMYQEFYSADEYKRDELKDNDGNPK